jgi:transposase
MPWKECSVMDERLRFVAKLLDGESMSGVCREFGISRKTGYKIFSRYKESGFEALSDRCRRPVRYANQLPPQIESLIVGCKREKPHWGARKIRELLVRRLQRRVQARQWAVLLPAHRHRPRFALPAPVRSARVDARRHGDHRLRATCQRRLKSDPPSVEIVGVNLTHPGP